MLDILRRLGERLSDLSEKHIPDPYVIAIVLTFAAVAAALATGAGTQETMRAWNGGVWTLLPFMASIANLRARDIIGYTTVAILAGLVIVGGWLTLFLAVL